MKDKEYQKDFYEMMRLRQKLGVTEDPEMPINIRRQLKPTVKNYFESDLDHQRLGRMTSSIQGKTDKYVFQMSNGSQQIKLYEPHKYKNNINTPLRIRTRMIMHLAYQEPCLDVKERIKELHYTYPYHLLKTEPVNLRLRNFRFEKGVREGDCIEIYETTSPSDPYPGSDLLITSRSYSPKKAIIFEFNGQEEQYCYALNKRSNSISNVLHFIWNDEIQTLPGGEKSETGLKKGLNDQKVKGEEKDEGCIYKINKIHRW